MRLLGLVLGLVLTTFAGAAAAQDASAEGHLPLRKAIAAPQGFGGLCGRYAWVCAIGTSRPAPGELDRVVAINRRVNHATRQITDQNQYGTDDVWALPTARGGDCEDIALLKKKRLIEAGVAPGRLLIATVLDLDRNLHSVLVYRGARADYVLDNLTGRVRVWRDTGYSFLEIQNPRAPQHWAAVLAGGAFG